MLRCDWESEFFGFDVYHQDAGGLSDSELKLIIDDCSSKSQFLLRVTFSKNRNLQEKLANIGFYHVDDLINFEKNLGGCFDLETESFPSFDINPPLYFGLLQKKHTILFEEFSCRLFIKSKYYFDKRYKPDRVDQMYADWFSRSLNGESDDFVLGITSSKSLVAFASIKQHTHTVAGIGLFAIIPEYQGQGIGKTFIKNLCWYLHVKGFKNLLVATQSRNFIAKKLYRSSEFKPNKTVTTMHCWSTNILRGYSWEN